MTTPTKIGTLKNNPWFWACMAVLSAIVANAFIQSCDREPVTKRPAEVIRTGIINTDTITSRIEAKYRERETKLTEAHKAELAALKAKLPKSKGKAVASVKNYQTAPTLAKCDTAIADLQSQVSNLETAVSISDTIIAGQGRVITSFAGTVARKDSVIGTLNDGWQEANAENAKLTRKVKRKNTLLKISGGILAVLGIIVAAK